MIAMTMTTMVAERTSFAVGQVTFFSSARPRWRGGRYLSLRYATTPATVAMTAATSEILKSLGGSAEVTPDPVDRPLQQIEQDHRPDQVIRWTGLFGAFSCWATASYVVYCCCGWQGRQDLNLQPSALETDALPIELLP